MPVFDMLETVLVKKLKFRPTWYLRFITRNIYVGKYIGKHASYFDHLKIVLIYKKIT